MPVATNDDLTGFGFSAQQSTLLGGNPSLRTSTVTTQSGATVLLSRNTEVSAAAGSTAFVPPSDARVMSPYFITNQATSTAALIYVPSGHNLNGSANASVSLAQFKSIILWQYKPKNWTYNLTA